MVIYLLRCHSYSQYPRNITKVRVPHKLLSYKPKKAVACQSILSVPIVDALLDNTFKIISKYKL